MPAARWTSAPAPFRAKRKLPGAVPENSAAGDAHVAGNGRALMAAIDDEIVALRLAADRFQNGGVKLGASEALSRSTARRSAWSSWPRHI